MSSIKKNNFSAFYDKKINADDEFNNVFDIDYRGDKAVISSISSNHQDFCYRESYVDQIVTSLNNTKKSSVFYIQKDRDGNFEYAHFIPALYYLTDETKGYTRVAGNFSIDEIPKKIECVIIYKKKRCILKQEGALFVNDSLLKAIKSDLV